MAGGKKGGEISPLVSEEGHVGRDRSILERHWVTRVASIEFTKRQQYAASESSYAHFAHFHALAKYRNRNRALRVRVVHCSSQFVLHAGNNV